jgi:hypothetical protein
VSIFGSNTQLKSPPSINGSGRLFIISSSSVKNEALCFEEIAGAYIFISVIG